MKDLLNSFVGKASRHLISGLATFFTVTGVSSGAATEVATGLIAFGINLLVSHKLEN